jgi:hypothetical protein
MTGAAGREVFLTETGDGEDTRAGYGERPRLIFLVEKNRGTETELLVSSSWCGVF